MYVCVYIEMGTSTCEHTCARMHSRLLRKEYTLHVPTLIEILLMWGKPVCISQTHKHVAVHVCMQDSIVISISAWHTEDPGSVPVHGVFALL